MNSELFEFDSGCQVDKNRAEVDVSTINQFLAFLEQTFQKLSFTAVRAIFIARTVGLTVGIGSGALL